MASLEHIHYYPHHGVVSAIDIKWQRADGPPFAGVPQIFWASGEPWREANMWAIERVGLRDVEVSTVQSNFLGLHGYANWLERMGANWWDLPQRKSDRCIYRHRGELIRLRNAGRLSPSTASERMRSIIAFYRWVYANRILSSAWPVWQDRKINIRLASVVGLERTIAVTTTDLSIPNRKARGERLEDGLLPVSTGDREKILLLARQKSPYEFFLMLSLGFFTGMRIGTIASLKVDTLLNAVADPMAEGLYRLSVGPHAIPAVATKQGVSGQIWITKNHLDELIAYSHSVRRLTREAKAAPNDKDLVFLTRFGRPYTQRDSRKNGAVNVEMHELRKVAAENGMDFMRDFRFHRSRVTFGTEIARILIPLVGATNCLEIVKDALLHKDEAMSMKYIKFVEKTPGKIAVANEFTRAFCGLAPAC